MSAFRTGSIRILALLTLLLAAAPAIGCALVFADWLPADTARYRAYRAANQCTTGSAAHSRREDCLRDVELTVAATVIHPGGRGKAYQATVEGDRFRGELDFGDPGPLLNTLEAGDTVLGTVWRGAVVALAKDGVRQSTADEPRDEPQMIAAVGAGFGLLALLGLAFGAVRLAAPHSPGRFVWRGPGKYLLLTVLLATFAVGLPAVWLGLPWQLVAPVMAAVTLAVAVPLLRRPTAAVAP